MGSPENVTTDWKAAASYDFLKARSSDVVTQKVLLVGEPLAGAANVAVMVEEMSIRCGVGCAAEPSSSPSLVPAEAVGLGSAESFIFPMTSQFARFDR